MREILAELAASPFFLSSPTGTPLPTAPGPSTRTPATRASTVLVLRLNRSSRAAQCGPSLTSAALPSILRGTGLHSIWKLAACLGYQTPSRIPLGHEVSHLLGSHGARKHLQSGKPQCASPAVALEFPTASDYSLEYRKGSANGNADFMSRFPEHATEHDRSGSSILTPVNDGGIFLIRACGLHTRASRIPGVVLSGLVPHSERCFGWTPFRLFGFSRLSHTRATYED